MDNDLVVLWVASVVVAEPAAAPILYIGIDPLFVAAAVACIKSEAS
jgi:hypothetical protein